MADVDELARRTTSLVTDLARKAGVLATWFAMVVLAIGGLSYLTGLAGLEGSARSAWALVGAVMLVIAVGAPLLARWRLSSVRRHATDLVGDLRTLISRDGNAQRVVIETIAVEEHDPAEVRDLRPVVYDSRQFNRLRQVSGTATDLRALPRVMRTVTTFPALLAIGLIGIVVFGTLGFFFLLAWIF
jgi:hypothetical protein